MVDGLSQKPRQWLSIVEAACGVGFDAGARSVDSASQVTVSPNLATHVLTLVAAVAGGFVFSLLHVPLAWAMGLPPSAVRLDMAPGGMPEMGVTAKALGVAVPLVLGFHLTRTQMCNFLLGPIHRGLVRLGLFRPHGSA